jgi:SAM-dependent methyltransferase
VNLLHLWYCRSKGWSRAVEQRLLPWVLAGVDLGDSVLELGPGFGVTTRHLAALTADLTAVEVDQTLAARLTRTAGDRVTVMHADATALPQDDRSFSAVVCFTMLHHLPSPQAQDRLFAEAFRVLRPGGVFAGSDSRTSRLFRLYHLADTMTPVDPAGLPARLAGAGFANVDVTTAPETFRFRANRPH